MAETDKPKRFAIKILEKDFDQITAWMEKWNKNKSEDQQLTLEESVDYVMQTATVRINALERYAKKQKAARKEANAKKPPKPKKVKADKPAAPKKPRKKKTPAASVAEAPEPASASAEAPAAS